MPSHAAAVEKRKEIQGEVRLEENLLRLQNSSLSQLRMNGPAIILANREDFSGAIERTSRIPVVPPLDTG